MTSSREETKIEIEVAEDDLEKVLGAIEDCTDGAYGDKNVFVYSLDVMPRDSERKQGRWQQFDKPYTPGRR